MHIKRVPTALLAEIVAGLVRQGVGFEVKPHDCYEGEWVITLTGGY
jgi:hypothetical protein